MRDYNDYATDLANTIARFAMSKLIGGGVYLVYIREGKKGEIFVELDNNDIYELTISEGVLGFQKIATLSIGLPIICSLNGGDTVERMIGKARNSFRGILQGSVYETYIGGVDNETTL